MESGEEENARGSRSEAKGSLDGLAQRLGALEESLTVVAGELGVSGLPRFRSLDPEAVYGEAVRQAREAVEPLRAVLDEAQAKLAQMAQAQALLRHDLAITADRYASSETVAALGGRLATLAARLDELHERIEFLALRLDAIWERLAAPAAADSDGGRQDVADAALLQRLAALEARVEQAEAGSGRDDAAIAAEVSRQIAALVQDAAAASASAKPLLGAAPADKALDADPLVMSAAERAIVRLTHRLEKLEEWRRENRGPAKSRRGVMSRFFET
ncbi:MAG: hypothetical protein AB7R90_15080 [Reyranellaceae bacterium]